MLLGVLFAWNKVGGEQLRVNKICDQKDSVSPIYERICGFSSSNKVFLDLLKQLYNKQKTLQQ